MMRRRGVASQRGQAERKEKPPTKGPFPVPYNVIVLVGVWRSAGRFSGERQWADLARIVTVIGMILLSII